MDAPTFVFAEAGVKSNRRGAQSIFEADPRSTDYKQFLADPTAVREAVSQLKKAGFQISSAGKYSISFFGSRALFEEKFNARLVMEEVVAASPNRAAIFQFLFEGNPPTIFRNTQDSAFKDWLDGIVLKSPMINANAAIPPPKTAAWQLYVNEIPDQLDLKLIHRLFTGIGIKIAVIDTGYFKHPFLTTNFKAKVKWQQTDRLFRAHEQALSDYIGAGSAENRVKLEKYEKFRTGSDADGHGTAVVSNLIPIAPDAEVFVIKELIEDGDYTDAFNLALGFEPDIICCAFGLPVQINNFFNVFMGNQHYQARINEIVAERKITVVYAAGNFNINLQNRVYLEPQFQNVLSVGGAYFENQILTASNAAHGFPSQFQQQQMLRAIPDTCGIVGPQDKLNYIGVPQPPSDLYPDGDWDFQTGTSYAAPQIAGVCALIKEALPTAKPHQIKSILQKTARPIAAGHTLQNQSMNNIDLGGGRNPGLVDIHVAVLTAYFMSYGMTIDDAIVKARG